MADLNELYDRMNAAIGNAMPSRDEIEERRATVEGAAQWLTQRASRVGEQASRLGAITVAEPEDFPQAIRRAFPGLRDQEAASLYQAYERERQRQINIGRVQFHASESRTRHAAGAGAIDTIASAVPGLTAVASLIESPRSREAIERFRAGTPTDEDIRIIGNNVGRAEEAQGRGAGRRILDTVAGSVGLMGEFLLGGPVSGAARAGGARLAGSLAGRVAGVAGQVAPMVAIEGTANTAERLVPSLDPSMRAPTLGEAAAGGYTEAAIEGLSEMAGRPISQVANRIPVLGRVFRRLTPGRNSILAQGGFNGIVGEMLEERISEVGMGATGVRTRPDGSPDYGLIHQFVRGETEEAFRQLGIEAGAFGIMGVMGGSGWNVAGRALRLGRRLQDGPALLTLPPLDPDADLTQRVPDRFGRTGETLGQRYEQLAARVEGRNAAVVQDWLETTPTDNLARWQGQFGITQELVNRRREADRLKSEAVEAARRGVSQQRAQAEISQRLNEIGTEIQRQSREVLARFRDGLAQVQNEILNQFERPNAQEGLQNAPGDVFSRPEGVQTSRPVQTSPEASQGPSQASQPAEVPRAEVPQNQLRQKAELDDLMAPREGEVVQPSGYQIPRRPVPSAPSVPTGPSGVSVPSGRQDTPVPKETQRAREAFASVFPDMRVAGESGVMSDTLRVVDQETGQTLSEFTVSMTYDPASDMANIDFGRDPKILKTGELSKGKTVSKGLEPGSLDFMKEIKKLLQSLKEKGIGVEYVAQDSNRGPHRGTREAFYEKLLTKTGFEKVGEKQGNAQVTHQWKPIKERKVFEDREEKSSSRYKQLLNREVEPRTLREAVIHAGGISTASIREQYGIKSKGERVREGGGISLREIPFLTNLVRNEGQPLDTLATSLAHEGWFGARPSGETTTADYTERLLDLLENNPNLEQGGNVAEEELQKEYDRFRRAQEKGSKAVREYLNQLREQGATEQELADAIEEARRQGYSPESIAESLRSSEETGEGEGGEKSDWNQDDGLLTAEEVAAGVEFDPFDEATPEPAPSAGTPKERAVAIFAQLLKEKYSAYGMVPIWEVRQIIRDRYGPEEASHAQLDATLRELRREGQLRLVAVGNAGDYSAEQLEASIPGDMEIFVALEVGRDWQSPVEARAEPAPSAARITRPSTPQPTVATTSPTPGGRTAEELEADPDYDAVYEPYADIFDTFTKGGRLYNPKAIDNESLADALRILDRVASWEATTPGQELEKYVANKIKRDYATEIEAARRKARVREVTPIEGVDPKDVAKRLLRGDRNEAALLAGMTPEQIREMEEEMASLLAAETARMQSEIAATGQNYYDPSRMEERKPRGRGRRNMRPGDYASMGVGALPSNAAQGEPISQYGLIANMSRRFNVPWYVHNLSKQAAAVYAMRPRAILVNNMSAGNAPVFMHEVAHDIDQKQKLFPDVNAVRALPGAVQRGLQSWDYDPANHDETTSAAEGFAEYLRMAVTGQLGSMSADQQAAQAWINTRLQAVPGLWDSLQETAADFRRFVGMTSTQQAAAGISASGEAERPELTNGQRLSEASGELWTNFRKAFENDQVALEAFENTATRLGKKWKIRPSEVMFQLRSAAPHYAAEMLQNGVFGFQFGPDGEIVRRVRLGQGLDDIIKGLEKADLEEVYQGGVSRFETYFLARHIMAEEAEGRPTVGEASLEYYRRALDEMKQDAGFIARAEPAAERFTQAFNATLDARAVAGIITQAQAETLKERRPTYAPLDRVPEASNWKRLWRKFTGRKESLDSGIRTRSGSDLAILSPFKAYMARLNFLSMLMSRQAERMALIGTVKTPGMSDVKLQGMGDFLVEVPQPVVPNRTMVTPEQISELLVKMGLEQDVVSDMIHEDMTPAELLYFTKSPVPVNGKPHLVVLEQGQPHFYRVGDKGLYDLFVGDRTLPEVAPLKIFRMMTKAIKFGATSANPIFQAYNITRDSLTFARNTIDIGSVKDLPMALSRAYIYMARLGMGATREQLAAFDPAMTLYLSHAGEWTQQVNFDAKGIDQRYRDIVGRHGITKIMDFGRDSAQSIIRFIGAAEHAPRVVEMRNYLRQQGFTDAEIERAARGEADAIPEWQVQRAMVAAAEVTTPFNRLGYLSRFLNLYIPFFGPSISGLSKGIRQAVNNPTRVAGMTALAMAMEILHWLGNKDEPWYQELDDYQRNRWYVMRIGNTLIRFPKSREFEMIGANGLQQFLRMQSDSNPRFAGWLRDTMDQFTPPLWPSGLGTAWQIATNRDWRGNPIVPRADLDLPWQENFGRRTQYAFEQMTGGLTNRGRVQIPGVVNSPPAQSMQDFYDQYSTLSSQRLAYGRANRVGDQADYSGFPQEQEFARLDTYNGLMRNFSRARSATSGETRRAIEQARVDITATIMGYRGAQMPALASMPQEVRQETEEWLGGVLRQATQPRDPDTTRQRGESLEAFRERSRRADAQRERQRETARSIVQEWRLSPAEQERLLRETLRRQGMGGEAIMRRVGRLRAS